MPHEPDWVMLTVAFMVGLILGISLMYAFRNYEVRQVLRLKGELARERRVLWDEIKRDA